MLRQAARAGGQLRDINGKTPVIFLARGHTFSKEAAKVGRLNFLYKLSSNFFQENLHKCLKMSGIMAVRFFVGEMRHVELLLIINELGSVGLIQYPFLLKSFNWRFKIT